MSVAVRHSVPTVAGPTHVGGWFDLEHDLRALAIAEIQLDRNAFSGFKRLSQANKHHMKAARLQGHGAIGWNIDLFDFLHSGYTVFSHDGV
jgi:hypothetical protein